MRAPGLKMVGGALLLTSGLLVSACGDRGTNATAPANTIPAADGLTSGNDATALDMANEAPASTPALPPAQSGPAGSSGNSIAPAPSTPPPVDAPAGPGDGGNTSTNRVVGM